jgi:hypothetical protein
MADAKVRNSELIKLRLSRELREFALAAFYPQTHSGPAAHLKRAEDARPLIPSHPLLGRLRDKTDPHESVAALEVRPRPAQLAYMTGLSEKIANRKEAS